MKKYLELDVKWMLMIMLHKMIISYSLGTIPLIRKHKYKNDKILFIIQQIEFG